MEDPQLHSPLKGGSVINNAKITTPVTIAILYRGGCMAGAWALREKGVNQNSKPVCFANLGNARG